MWKHKVSCRSGAEVEKAEDEVGGNPGAREGEVENRDQEQKKHEAFTTYVVVRRDELMDGMCDDGCRHASKILLDGPKKGGKKGRDDFLNVIKGSCIGNDGELEGETRKVIRFEGRGKELQEPS